MYRDHLKALAEDLVRELIRKDEEYGSSWLKRGGQGAFMMLARKMDRLDVQVSASGYDVFAAIDESVETSEDLRDTLRDLAGYAFLILSEHIDRSTFRSDPGEVCGYCNDRFHSIDEYREKHGSGKCTKNAHVVVLTPRPDQAEIERRVTANQERVAAVVLDAKETFSSHDYSTVRVRPGFRENEEDGQRSV